MNIENEPQRDQLHPSSTTSTTNTAAATTTPSNPFSIPDQMQNAYSYPAQLPPEESFRHPASVAPMHHAAVSLPPLRMEPQIQQHSHMYSQLSSPPLTTYYHVSQPPIIGHHGPLMHSLSAGPAYMNRYPIPVAAGRANKKEIKRRTKTGCMTCRKRRIKCDELHPTCRNCMKSKRECLGYDPIFKNQSSHKTITPSRRGDSPVASTSTATASPTTTSTTITTTSSLPVAPAQASIPPAVSAPLSVAQSYTPSPTSHAVQPPPAAPYTSASSFNPINTNHVVTPASKLPAMTPSVQVVDHDGQLSDRWVSEARPVISTTAFRHLHRLRTVLRKPRADFQLVRPSSGVMRPVAVELLFLEKSQSPHETLASPVHISHPALYAVSRLYSEDLAAGLDNLLEVDWYTKRGLSCLLESGDICRLADSLIKHYEAQQNTRPHVADTEALDQTKALECKTIWTLLCLPRQSPAYRNSTAQLGTSATLGDFDFSHRETSARLQVLEALLTNTVLPHNPLDAIQYPNELSPSNRTKVEFWYSVGRFVNTMNEQVLWSIIEGTTGILNCIENRDVVHSIMVCRYFADRIEGFTSSFVGHPTSFLDQINRALLAKLFLIKQEDGQGTNRPIQRICHMAVQSWNHR